VSSEPSGMRCTPFAAACQCLPARARPGGLAPRPQGRLAGLTLPAAAGWPGRQLLHGAADGRGMSVHAPRGHATGSHRAMLATSATEREAPLSGRREAPLSVVLPGRGPLSQAPCPAGHQQQRPSPALGAASRAGFAEAHGAGSGGPLARIQVGKDEQAAVGRGTTVNTPAEERALGTPNSTELTRSNELLERCQAVNVFNTSEGSSSITDVRWHQAVEVPSVREATGGAS
jgi:hypothetical protein